MVYVISVYQLEISGNLLLIIQDWYRSSHKNKRLNRDSMSNLDLQLFRAINGIKQSWLDKLMWLLSFIPALILAWSYIIFRFSRHNPQGAWQMTVLMLGAFIFIVLFKEIVISKIFFRKRPYLELTQTKNLGTHFMDSSFPSAHVSTMTALSIIYLSFNITHILFFAVWTFLAAFSRIYSGAHYPSDTLAGLLFGGVVGWLAVVVGGMVFV